MRLETMVLMAFDLPLIAIQRQIASGIDIIVHLGRMRDKSRKVVEIVEIVGMKNKEIELNTLFSLNQSKSGKQQLQFVNKLIHCDKMDLWE